MNKLKIIIFWVLGFADTEQKLRFWLRRLDEFIEKQ